MQKLPSQRTITRALKAHDRKQFVSELPEGDKLRLKAVSRQAVPAQSQESDIAPGDNNRDSLYQTPMSLHGLMCQYELSNETFLVTSAITLALVSSYGSRAAVRDIALNGSSSARIKTHNRIANEVASIARESGIQMEAGEKFVPVVQVSVTAAGGRRQATNEAWPTYGAR